MGDSKERAEGRTGTRFREWLEDGTHRAGPPEGSYSGAAGGSACGDLVRISILPGEGGSLEKITWDAEGCSATRAAAAALSGSLEGRSAIEAAAFGAGDLTALLGDPGSGARHAIDLASDALHRALSAFASSDLTIAPPDEDRIAVALSGGVDSAVAALLLAREGRSPVAITVKLWADPQTDGTLACCSPEAVLSARRLAHSLGLPHFTLDLEEAFRTEVVSRFVEGYRSGTTPNPCIACNGKVRIDAMVDLAARLGAGRLATGHYAALADDGAGTLLAEAEDPDKDQSYMLAGLAPETAARLEFPLARVTKSRVRQIASEAGLGVARKPESQDLCFLAGTDKDAFLARHAGLGTRPGPIVDRDGEQVGTHSGHHRFTVGQRRGLGVAVGEPRYVTAVDPSRNEVEIGTRQDLMVEDVVLRRATLLRDGSDVDRVRLRYRSEPVPASVRPAAGFHDRLEVRLHRPFAGPSPGQTAVLMRGSAIIGHGTIE